MRNEPEKRPAALRTSIDSYKELPDNMNQVNEYLNLYRFKTQEALDGLEDNIVRVLRVHRRWNLALSALVGALCIAVSVLLIRFYNTPNKMMAAAAHNPAVAAEPDSEHIATDTPPAPETDSKSENNQQASPATAQPAAPKPETPKSATSKSATSKPAESKPANLLAPDKAEKTIKLRSEYALTYFKRATFDRLAAKYIHPEKGVHFYPLGLKAAGSGFTPKTFANAMFNPVKFDWGVAEAKGDPIKSQFVNYYKTYVYDEDFLTSSSVRFNEISFPGKHALSAAAIASKYPNCIFTEYQKNGKSLILVFQHYNGPGVWYLVGVIHNA